MPSLTDPFFWKCALLMTLPLVVGGVLHMLVVRWDVLACLKRPLSRPLFGANKTWRGFALMPLLTLPGIYAAAALASAWDVPLFEGRPLMALGLSLGLAYVLFELPNSYVKRRLGVAPGETSQRWPWLFSFVDQTDSALGCILVYALFGIGAGSLYVTLFFFGAVVHVIVNLLLWALGLRKNPL